jgi:hypothetical protein
MPKTGKEIKVEHLQGTGLAEKLAQAIGSRYKVNRKHFLSVLLLFN